MAINFLSPTSSRTHRFSRVKSRNTTSILPTSLQVSSRDPQIDIYEDLQGQTGPQDHWLRLPPRPSTAGATVAKDRPDSRQPRDNIHFDPLAAHCPRKNVYDFPLPGSSHIAIRYSTISTAYSSTTESNENGTMSSMNSSRPQDHMIGMALGSPNHPPMPPQHDDIWFDRAATESPDTLNAVIDIWKDQAQLTKPKTSKWKSLGLFWKKPQKSSQTFYQLRNEPPPGETPAAPSGSGLRQQPSPPSQPSTKQAPRIRTRTNPERTDKQQTPGPNQKGTASLDMEFRRSQTFPSATPEIQLDGGPLLNVDIPDVQMERYSVMFGSLLKSDQPKARTSLLARRQATLDKLKVVNEAIAEHVSRLTFTNSAILTTDRNECKNRLKAT